MSTGINLHISKVFLERLFSTTCPKMSVHFLTMGEEGINEERENVFRLKMGKMVIFLQFFSEFRELKKVAGCDQLGKRATV